MRTNRVLVPGKNQVLLEEIEIADRPGPGQVMVETEATFISAGTELANFTALTPQVYEKGSWCEYPWPSGYANVGRVIELGERIEDFEVGDRVFSFGKHQQIHFVTHGGPGLGVSVAGSLLVKVPEDLDAAVAAACRMPLVAMSSLSNTSRRLNDTVGVWGLGMVGNMAAQLFQLAGCRVIGIDPAVFRRDLAQAVGIGRVASPEPADVETQMGGLGADDGLDIAIDAVGESAILAQIHRFVRRFGQVTLLGSPRREHVADMNPLLSDIHWRGLKLRGSLEWLIPLTPQTAFGESTLHNIETVLDLVARGRLQVEPLISHRMPPQQIERAYQGLLNDKEHYSGVALIWNE